MKRIKHQNGVRMIALSTLLLLCLALCVPTIIQADGGNNSVTVVRYQTLRGEQDLGMVFDGREIERQDLDRMAGVSYQLILLEYRDGGYVPALNHGFPLIATTDTNGIARFENLPDGRYRLVELAHERIATPNPPVEFYLPFIGSDGELVRDVFIYPKSNVTEAYDPGQSPGSQGPPGEPGPQGPQGPPGQVGGNRLPQTSGNIGSMGHLLLFAGGILLFGGFGFLLCKKRTMVK